MTVFLLPPDDIDEIVARARKTQKSNGRVYMCNVTREHFGRERRGGPVYQQIRKALKDAGIYLRGRTAYYEEKSNRLKKESIPGTPDETGGKRNDEKPDEFVYQVSEWDDADLLSKIHTVIGGLVPLRRKYCPKEEIIAQRVIEATLCQLWTTVSVLKQHPEILNRYEKGI